MIRELIRRLCNHVLKSLEPKPRLRATPLGRPAMVSQAQVLKDTQKPRIVIQEFLESFALKEGSALSFIALYTSPEGENMVAVLTLSSHREDFMDLLSRCTMGMAMQLSEDAIKKQEAVQAASEQARRN